jgi:NADPH-dependent glutamate synthase beta subunit-like oxidoreductase
MLGGVYAAGDDVRGADLIVTAIAAGRKAAQAMDRYLRSRP